MVEALSLTLTPSAVERVRALLRREELGPEHGLRVRVVGGGCSGYSYQLDFDDVTREDDHVLDFDGVRVRVDRESAAMLQGLQIDFVERLHGGGFTFTNPNAASTCGCGTSFSV
jgi:iron-sulfur cluster assembly accessory protein